MSLKTWWKQHFTLGILLSGTAASLIAAAIWELGARTRPNAVTSLRPLVVKLGGWIATSWAWITGSVRVPRWWYALLLLYMVVTVFMAIARWLKLMASPSRREYTQDIFNGVRWRWQFSAYYGYIDNLAPYCLKCDRQLIPGKETFKLGSFHELRNTLDCRQHGRQFDFPGDGHELLAEIEDEISLKLRNGSWKEAVRQQSPGQS